jgi:hypothetical protein
MAKRSEHLIKSDALFEPDEKNMLLKLSKGCVVNDRERDVHSFPFNIISIDRSFQLDLRTESLEGADDYVITSL